MIDSLRSSIIDSEGVRAHVVKTADFADLLSLIANPLGKPAA
jgi:hypothetical protein